MKLVFFSVSSLATPFQSPCTWSGSNPEPTKPVEPTHIKSFLHTPYGLGLARVLPLNPVIDMLSSTSVSLPSRTSNSSTSSCSCAMSCGLRPPLTSSLTAISPQRVLLDGLPCLTSSLDGASSTTYLAH